MAIVIDGGTTKDTLSWADSFIKDLLAESEKYQDVIKNLSDDAIAATVRQLDYGSEEYVTGTEILQNRATSSTSHVLVEVDEEVDEDAFKVSTDTDKANKEADAEADERGFDSERATSGVLIKVNAEIDKLLQEIEEKQNDFWRTLEQNLNIIFDSLWEPIWEWFPELEADVTYQLAALPAVLLFEAFKNFFFEED